MTARLRRSALYVPASNMRAMDKARSLPCDVVIIDLEDAVAPSGKAAAREAATAAIRAGGFGRREVVIRVNGLDTPWGAEDLAAINASRPAAVLAPKVTSGGDVLFYRQALSLDIELWAMVETCAAVLQIGAVSGCAGLSALVFGSNDLAAEMGASVAAGRQPLHAALGMTVMAAKAHGLDVLDGVFNRLDDPDGFSAECIEGATFGFDGKTLIHPSQIADCHAAFMPNPAMVARARAIVTAFEAPQNADLGVILVDGRMTERLHLAQAQRLLAIHEAAIRADLP